MILSRISILLLNVVFLGGSLYLMSMSIVLSSDTERVLIAQLIPSPLPNPILYYCAIGTVIAGLIYSLVSLLGFFVVRVMNSCLLALYIFSIVVLLLGESVLILITLLCPEYLGIALDGEELLDKWQRNYGLPGREQYTAAIDLVQTKFDCCGVDGGSDFKTSWWTIRELAAPNLTVPLSCCLQGQMKSYLDPVPLNATMCQDINVDKYRTSRHTEGCLKSIELWMSEHVEMILSAVVCLLLYQLILLLVSILLCVQRSKSNIKQTKM